MKLQHSVIFIGILKAVSGYPSCDSEALPEDIYSSFEIINPGVGIPSPYLDEAHICTEKIFPDVEYPTKMLVDTIEPFFYRTADHDDILEPFTTDVKDSYKSLETQRKVKENSVHQDCNVSPTEINMQHIIKESYEAPINDSLFYHMQSEILTPVVNTTDISTSDANACSQASDGEEVEVPKDLSCETNTAQTNIEPVPTDNTDSTVTTQDDVQISKPSDKVECLDYEKGENIEV